MNRSSSERDAAVAEATAVLEAVRADLMARPGVCGTYVGLLRDSHGALTEVVGIVVIVDPTASSENEPLLPEQVGGFVVQAVRGTPSPGA